MSQILFPIKRKIKKIKGNWRKIKKDIILILINIFILSFLKKILKVNKSKVVYIPVHFQCQGNTYELLKKWSNLFGNKFIHIYLCEESKRSNKHNIKYVKFGLKFLFHYSTAKYIIRESEFNSVGLWPSKKSVVAQLWHGAGAFKKFGLHTKRSRWLKFWRKKDIESWDIVFCSSEFIKDIYSVAFGDFDRDRIFVNGLPRNDFLFSLNQKRNDLKSQMNIENKKIILFAPTFRDKEFEEYYLDMIEDINFISKKLPKDFQLAIRLHPSVPQRVFDFIDFSDILDFNAFKTEESLVIADILITDYSSIIFDFALLEKPMLFYAPDLDVYYDKRGFYFDYKSFVPGPISYSKEELLENIKQYDWLKWQNKVKEFKEKFNPYFDGKNSERVINKILEIGEKYG
ncbi:CDP-glycerol glycerophosphotransferase family protein [Hippea alviniae]|uniref:CDP-glycerol glycerophosphotransferase family protein n=1 Tax=Hippea alviniae TaxID=1279027 RepID=UPI0003B3AF92|nr:CDP-glycerol glycerophosphotransferase family protein [Hippea alviniae]